MSKYVGRKAEIGLAKEATRGTSLVPTVWLGRNTISFNDKVTTARNEQALGRIEDSDGNHVTGKFSEGDFEYDMEDKALGLILTSLFGSSPVSAGGPTYTHTYTLQNTNTHQSLSLTVQDPDTTKVFPLAVVDSVNVSVGLEGIVKLTVNWMARQGKDYAPQTSVFTGLGNKFLHQHLRFKLASNIAGIAAASEISLKSFDMTISTNTVLDKVLGTLAPEDVLNQQFSIEGSLELNKEDETYRDYMLDGTYRAAEVKLERSSSSILQLQFPRWDFTEWDPDYSLNEIAKQSINFKGNYDAANALAIISTAVLTNTDDGSNY